MPEESENLRVLCSIEEVDGMLTMLDGSYFPLDAKQRRSKMMIRDSYQKLMPMIEGHKAVFLTGTPGTGGT